VPSYSPVFSAPLIQYTTAAPNTSFEVPEGFTAVVRQVTVLVTVGALSGGLFVADDVDAPPLWLDYWNELGVLAIHHQEGRWVCPGGSTLFIVLSELSYLASCYVGGYLLRNSLS